MRGQQRLPARHGPFPTCVVALIELAEYLRTNIVAPVIQLFLKRIFEDLAFLFDDQDFVEAGREVTRVLRVERPHAAHFQYANADACAGLVIERQIGQRLPHIEIGFARGHDAETRRGAVDHHTVQFIGADVGEGRVPLVVEQTGFLRERRIGPADIESAIGHVEVVRQYDLQTVRIDIDRRARFDHVGHTFHRDPQAGIAAHCPAVQSIVEIFLHARRIQHRNAARDEHMLGLVRDRRRLRRMIVASQHQHATVRIGAGRVRVLEDVACPVDARTFAVPHAEYAVDLGARPQVDLLRPPYRSGREVLVNPRLEHDIVFLEMLFCLPQPLVQRAER